MIDVNKKALQFINSTDFKIYTGCAKSYLNRLGIFEQ
jgi:hypothetical protein